MGQFSEVNIIIVLIRLIFMPFHAIKNLGLISISIFGLFVCLHVDVCVCVQCALVCVCVCAVCTRVCVHVQCARVCVYVSLEKMCIRWLIGLNLYLVQPLHQPLHHCLSNLCDTSVSSISPCARTIELNI